MRRRLVIAMGVAVLLLAGYLIAWRPDPVAVTTTTIITPKQLQPTYGPQFVERWLDTHGFEVDVVFDRGKGKVPEGSVFGLLALYTDLEGLDALIADSSPNGAIGSEISAWVFDTTSDANSFRVASGARLQRQNVVLLTDAAHEDAARRALDELG